MTAREPGGARVARKPISTLMAPLRTVDLKTGGPAQAQSERSDVTAVPAMGVIAEAMMALVLAQALLEKFGGDRSEEHTSELQSRRDLVCRLLLEKKKKNISILVFKKNTGA